MADLTNEQLTEILDKAPANVPHDDVMRELIAKGHTFAGQKFDPTTLKPVAALPKTPGGQTIYPQPPLAGGAPPPPGTDPVPDAARGLLAGFHGQDTPAGASMPEKIGAFVGKEGPAIAGGATAAAMTGGASIPASLGAAALGGGAGEAYRQIFGQNPVLGEKGLSSDEAAKLISVRALEQALGEGAGRLTKGAINLIRGASLKQLQGLTSLPSQYVERALERPNYALPKPGESLLTAESAAMKHLGDVQGHIEMGRREAGQGVDRALEALHVKTGGQKVADTQPLADAMRKIVDEKYRAADPTVQALAKTDMEKIAKVLRTMETTTETKPTGLLNAAGKPLTTTTVTPPMKSMRDLVAIRRELDNLVGYTPAGLPKMESDMGSQFAKALADEYRGLISKTAEAHGDKQLILNNAKFSDVAKNYDEFQSLLNTKTEGEPHLTGRIKSLGNYVGQGGAQAQTLETLKEAFPKGARAVDALHDALTRRALLKAEDVPSKSFIHNVIKQASGSKASPAAAIRAVRTGAGSSLPAAVQGSASLSSGVINALLAHIQPHEESK